MDLPTEIVCLIDPFQLFAVQGRLIPHGRQRVYGFGQKKKAPVISTVHMRHQTALFSGCTFPLWIARRLSLHDNPRRAAKFQENISSAILETGPGVCKKQVCG